MSERQLSRSRRFLRWLIAPVLALLLATAVVYNTAEGQRWLDTVAWLPGSTAGPEVELPASSSPADSPGDSPGDSSTGSTPGPTTAPLPSVPAPPDIPSPPPNQAVDAAKVAAIWGKALSSKAVGKHVSAAVSALNGTPASAATDFISGSDSVVPASTMKLLTTTAALEALGPDTRFTTRVTLQPRQNDRLGTLTLIGGGDPLLTRKPTPDSVPTRADLRTLARETAEALQTEGVRRVRLRYDTSLFTGPAGSSRWRADYLAEDIVAPITALWVDEGRPTSGFGRVEDPALTAAVEFAAALRRAQVVVVGKPTQGTASAAAAELAAVESPPLSQIVEHIVAVSDNEAAEVLAHHVGLAVAKDGSFEGGARGVATTLAALGVPLEGAAIFDGSGLSRANRLTSATLLAVLQVASQAERPELRAVLTGLPVAAYTGSLTNRFAEGPAAGRGSVRAKTGTLTGVHGLAGLVTDKGGTTYAFTIVADRVPGPLQLAARTTIDRLAARLAACTCSK